MTEYTFIDIRRVYKKEDEYTLPMLHAELLLDGETPQPPDLPPVGGDIPYSEGEAQIVLKNVGSSDHPSGYTIVSGYTKIGRRVFLDIRLFFDADYIPGSGGDESACSGLKSWKVLLKFGHRGLLSSLFVY